MAISRPTNRARLVLTAAKGILVASTSLVLLASVLDQPSVTPDLTRPGAAGAGAGAGAGGSDSAGGARVAGVVGLRAGASDSVQRAMDQHGCTETGFGTSATPRSALIVRAGELEHVSFDQGWSVFVGDRPGHLLAVCLSET